MVSGQEQDSISTPTDPPQSASALSKNPLKRNSDDIGWEYGELCDPNDKNAIKCKLCGLIFKSGIHQLKLHIAHKGSDVKKCAFSTAEDKQRVGEKLDQVKRSKAQRLLEAAEIREQVRRSQEASRGYAIIEPIDVDGDHGAQNIKQRKIGPMDLYATKNINVEKIYEKELRQARIEDSLNKKRADEVHEFVARWVYEAGIPFNAISHRSFIAMVEAIGRHGPGYRPPSRYLLSEPLLKREVERTKKAMQPHEEEWKKTGCSIMTDAWTDRKRRSVMNLCINSRLGTVFLSSKEESLEAHTAKYIAAYVNKHIDQIGEEKVFQVVTDNASNNMAASRIVLERRPKLFWSPCATHTINLMLEGISKLPRFNDSISKAKNLTTFIYAHHRTLALMRKFTEKRDIVRPGVTRFATAFLTLQSLLASKEKLRFMFCSEEWNKNKLSASKKGKEANATVLSTSFWSGVTLCIKTFSPLVKVLRLADGDSKPSMGFVYGELENAKKEIELLYKNNQKTCKAIMNIIESKGKDRIDTPLHKAAYFLNPYYLYNKDEMWVDGELNVATTNCIEKYFKDDPHIVSLVQNEELAQYKNKQGNFSKHGAIMGATKTSLSSFDPVNWWTIWGVMTPHLLNFAMRVLSLTTSASGCERNWSTFEGIHTKKRNRLQSERLNDLVFVQFNAKLSNKKRRSNENGDILLASDANTTNAQEWLVENATDGALDDEHEGEEMVPGTIDLPWSVVGTDELLNPRRSTWHRSTAPITIRELDEELEESSDDEPRAEEECAFVDSDEDRVFEVDTTGHEETLAADY